MNSRHEIATIEVIEERKIHVQSVLAFIKSRVGT